MKRGEVHFADLAPRSGSEQGGRRPVIVLSHDAFNESAGWRSVIVVPVSSSKSQERRGPTAVRIPAGEGGLDRPSVALCHKITILDRRKLSRLLGELPAPRLLRVGLGVRAALDLL